MEEHEIRIRIESTNHQTWYYTILDGHIMLGSGMALTKKDCLARAYLHLSEIAEDKHDLIENSIAV